MHILGSESQIINAKLTQRKRQLTSTKIIQGTLCIYLILIIGVAKVFFFKDFVTSSRPQTPVFRKKHFTNTKQTI